MESTRLPSSESAGLVQSSIRRLVARGRITWQGLVQRGSILRNLGRLATIGSAVQNEAVANRGSRILFVKPGTGGRYRPPHYCRWKRLFSYLCRNPVPIPRHCNLRHLFRKHLQGTSQLNPLHAYYPWTSQIYCPNRNAFGFLYERRTPIPLK